MAEATASNSTTETTTVEAPTQNRLVIHLHKPKTDKKVKWKEEVVDNELLGKKKSKCCCIYSKPHKFDESDTSDDEDNDDCCHEHKVGRHH